jgi:hypothetical protein
MQGYLNLRSMDGRTLWMSGHGTDRLLSGQLLLPGELLRSLNGMYRLTLQVRWQASLAGIIRC